MREADVASEILDAVGGTENIVLLEHCATRLRLMLADRALVDEATIETIDGVKGQFYSAGQYQIVLGTGLVNKVFQAMQERFGQQVEAEWQKKERLQRMTLLQKLSRTLGDVFVPIIPVLVATGLFMGLRGLLLSLGQTFPADWMEFTKVLTDTAFAFLPVLIAYSVVKRFGGSPVIGIVIGLMLVSPVLPNAYQVAAGSAQPLYFHLLGLNIPVLGYQGSVLPALCLSIIAAKLEIRLHRIIPDVLDLIVTPFLTLLISLLVGLFIIGPLMHYVEVFVVDSANTLLTLPYGIDGLVIGGLDQAVVITGLHHTFKALEVELLAKTGSNAFNALVSMAITSQGAAALAVSFKTRDKKKRALYFSSVVPAFLGITEPAIFGINLRLVKPFIFGCIGGAIGGMVASILHLQGTGMSITSVPGALLYMNGQLINYLLASLTGFAVAFIMTLLFFKSEE
ncbi:PTS sugar transporter subunit IIA [Izhakiella australiensis]|uniref:PTS system glucose-specific EIICB component n=1 Tax=Izhakiella australiensis TaxID=1926881 RepID=A0A1S8YRN3_9GAMM|nr:PTS transporter subunit EIIC [Izhakiella australiensis]OON41734.1 PTS sugar transporter subunit IIA [Izhakiella australiensis]